MTESRNYGVLGELEVPLALGLLRLSTEGRPEETEAIEVIHHALDNGLRVLDLADVYSENEKDLHYAEHLARKAIDSWSGSQDALRVVTKAGLERPKGRWRPNGRPERLRSSVDGSLKALGVDQLFLFLLHANDPQCPFEASLATLAELQQAGKIKHLGLCNVGAAEVFQAQRHFDVTALQCELSVMSRATATAGLVTLCRQLEIPFLAHRPLGGHAKVDKLLKNRAMKPLVKKYGGTPHEAALATLLDLPDPVLPVVGATQIESLDSSLRALDLTFDDEDREARNKISFFPKPEALMAIQPPIVPDDLPTLEEGSGPGDDPEVVLIMGVQGAGKSESVAAYEEAGYERLNRDNQGGKLGDLVPMLDELLREGKTRVVLDNTYPSRLSRYDFIRTAHRHHVPVRCVYMATPVREAQINVVLRMLDRYGHLPGGDELSELQKSDPNLPPPAAMVRFAASLEEPRADEGFSAVDVIPFVRRPTPDRTGKGLFLDVDGTLRITKSGEFYPRHPDDVELLPGRRKVLEEWIDRGYQLFFISNQSGVASNLVSREDVAACFDRTIELLELPITDVAFCPHKAFPVGCFCRKPLPGMGVQLMEKYELDPAQVVMVGDRNSDAQFAEAIGATYHMVDEFFGHIK